jgi:hypothetical protein
LGFPSGPNSAYSQHQPHRRTGGSISRAPQRRLNSSGNETHSPCCLQPATRNPSKLGHPKNPNELRRSTTTCSTAPTQGFWPLTSSNSPMDERLRSVRGPSSNRIQPNTCSTKTSPTRASTAKQTPPLRHRSAETTGLTAQLQLPLGNLHQLAQPATSFTDDIANPGIHREADTAAPTPKRRDGWTNVVRVAQGQGIRFAPHDYSLRGSRHQRRRRWRSRHPPRKVTFEKTPGTQSKCIA